MANGSDPAVSGEWKTLYDVQLPNGEITSVAHACLLRTGTVLFFQEADKEETIIWDPSDETNPNFTYPDNQPTNPDPERKAWLWCSGHSFLSDGTLLVCGGGGNAAVNALDTAWKFSPIAGNNGTWKRTRTNMYYKRWYPTVLTLDDGIHVMIVGGLPASYTKRSIEIYDANMDVNPPPLSPYAQNFREVITSGTPRDFPQTFPGLHLLPDGNIFYSRTGWHGGADISYTNAYFTFTGLFNGTDPNSETFNGEDPITGTWTEIPEKMEITDRREGMSVLLLSPTYPWVRVVIVGGTGVFEPGGTHEGEHEETHEGTHEGEHFEPGIVEKAETINLSSISPHWESSKIVPGGGRQHANAVLLPDNSIFVCGGTHNIDAPCALFNQIDNTWSEMAKMSFLKWYHSVVILLPSGKVMATGGKAAEESAGTPGGELIRGSTKIEVFSPPYLFKGPRPEIVAVPESIRKGDGFVIETPNAAEIQKVVLVSPMAVTHQTDTGQRVVQLNFQRIANNLYVDTLVVKQPNIAPNGYYMLFILNDQGVPSIARFIALQ
jgi:hypothetical protein